jgi:prepilin-type N-terminal cleavage/methylation domain-containing protein
MSARAPDLYLRPFSRTHRRGVTLLELLIVITLLGIVASVAVLAMPGKLTPPDDTAHRIVNARTAALRTGRPVTVILQFDTLYGVATAMPDGSVLADSAAHVDRLSGQPLRVDSVRRRVGS